MIMFGKFALPATTWFMMHYIGVAVAVSWAVIARPQNFPLSRFGILILSILVAAGGFFGARFAYAVIHALPGYGERSFSTSLSRGGWSFLGTPIAGIVIIFLAAKIRFRPTGFFTIADYAMPFVVLEQAFGRIGCFLAGCCHGPASNLPWACVFKSAGRVPRHPTQIYNTIAILINFALMRYLYRKGVPKGVVFFGTLCVYGFLRFFTEFFRVDSPHVAGMITAAQMAMLSIFLASGAGLLLSLRMNRTAQKEAQKK